jgi:hypothetical protein
MTLNRTKSKFCPSFPGGKNFPVFEYSDISGSMGEPLYHLKRPNVSLGRISHLLGTCLHIDYDIMFRYLLDLPVMVCCCLEM